MRFYNVCHLVRGLDFIDHHVQRRLENIVANDKGKSVATREIVDQVKPTLSLLRRSCVEGELQCAIRRIDGLHTGLRDGITVESLFNQLNELRRDIDADLEFRRFVFIPSEKATILLNVSKEWEVAFQQFFLAKSDIEDAVSCYALEQNNAAVFHLMRAVEWGLRAFCPEY